MFDAEERISKLESSQRIDEIILIDGSGKFPGIESPGEIKLIRVLR